MHSKKWERRFLELAKHVASWSKDPSTQVGAVLVSDDRRTIVIGYNGFPPGIEDKPSMLADREIKYDHTVHAEMNAILNSPAPVRGMTLYVWPFQPCKVCAKHIITAGIVRVVAPAMTAEQAGRWASDFQVSTEMFSKAGIELVIQEAS